MDNSSDPRPNFNDLVTRIPIVVRKFILHEIHKIQILG